MGHTRIETTARVLTSPPEQTQETLRLSASKKMQGPADTFEPAAPARDFARTVPQKPLNRLAPDVGQTSDAFRQILTRAKQIDEDEKPLQNVELYAKAAQFLTSDSTDKSLKNLAVATLKEAFEESCLHDPGAAARQMAVAFSSCFEATPCDAHHRQQVLALVESCFGTQNTLIDGVNNMLQESERAETTRLLLEMRTRDFMREIE